MTSSFPASQIRSLPLIFRHKLAFCHSCVASEALFSLSSTFCQGMDIMIFLCPLTLFLPCDQLHVKVLISIFKEKKKEAFPHSAIGKESTCNAGGPGLIPESGRSAGKGIGYPLQYPWASLVAQLVKNPPAVRETWIQSWVGKIPWRREELPTPVLWPGEFHGLYRPWGQQRVEHNWVTLTQRKIKFTSYSWLYCPQTL